MNHLRRNLSIAFLAVFTACIVSGQTEHRYVIPSDSVPTYLNSTKDIGMTILLDKESVGSSAALSLGTFLPGSGVPEHVHKDAAEIIYLLNGEIEMTIGAKQFVAVAGSAIYVPPNVPHSASVIGSIEPVKVVQIYSPGGPEQRFKDWGASP